MFVYFAALGLAYMFLEMAFIQRFMLFLAYPVYAVAVVLTAFLLFSGLGSLFAGSLKGPAARNVRMAVGAIAVCAGAYMGLLPLIFRTAAGWPDGAKIAVSVALLSPLAFCMGIPFPTGLQRVSSAYASLLPWAWGINGCFSVMGATLGTITAIHLGFRNLVALAVVAYVIAAAGLWRLDRPAGGKNEVESCES